HTRYPVPDPADKRMTHSLPGVLFIFVFTGAFLSIPALLVDRALAGWIAIFPFFPFSSRAVAGSIRPCDRTDPRIARYHIQHGTVLIVLFWLASEGVLAPALFLPLSVAGIGICLGTMVYFSEVSVRRDSGLAGIIKAPSPAKTT